MIVNIRNDTSDQFVRLCRNGLPSTLCRVQKIEYVRPSVSDIFQAGKAAARLFLARTVEHKDRIHSRFIEQLLLQTVRALLRHVDVFARLDRRQAYAPLFHGADFPGERPLKEGAHASDGACELHQQKDKPAIRHISVQRNGLFKPKVAQLCRKAVAALPFPHQLRPSVSFFLLCAQLLSDSVQQHIVVLKFQHIRDIRKLHGFIGIGKIAVPRQKYNFQVRILGKQLPAQRQAVLFRHVDVAHDQIDVVFRRILFCRLRPVTDMNIGVDVQSRAQCCGNAVCNIGLVVHD